MRAAVAVRRSDKVNGFTLVELLVVIGIIALLISILMPAVGSARSQANAIKCLSQLRQLGSAMAMYASDNRNWLPSCDTCGPLLPQTFADDQETLVLNNASATHTWVGWVDGGPLPAALPNGTLWKYLNNAAVYKCPADTNEYRTRSYSMNNLLCTGRTDQAAINPFKIFRITQVRSAGSTIAFAEESDPRNNNLGAATTAMATQWNINGWTQYPLAADNMTSLGTTANTWGDAVANFHRGGANFGFVDGHVEYWRFSDPRTVNFLKYDPNWPNTPYVTPGDPDLLRIRQGICTWPALRMK
jgi:prepilin-type N-terminal cleavage/methylation domain-containing protein/prepilin-type processing-associated H-X9-DG protein